MILGLVGSDRASVVLELRGTEKRWRGRPSHTISLVRASIPFSRWSPGKHVLEFLFDVQELLRQAGHKEVNIFVGKKDRTPKGAVN